MLLEWMRGKRDIQMEKLRIVVGGFIGLYPTGGVTWDYIQYPLGLKILGHDVYYIEDTAQYSRFQSQGKSWDDASDSIRYLKNTMERFGFADRWAYRDVASGKCYGLSLRKLIEVCKTADVFINVSASTFLRDEYLKIPLRALIDSDPMFTQIEYHDESLVKNTDRYKMGFIVNSHTHLFTFGENIESDDCKIPTFNLHWIPTRQPICLDYWEINQTNKKPVLFTSVMNWSVRDKLVFGGQEWGQKNTEFEKFMIVPESFPSASFEIKMTGITAEKKAKIGEHGWTVSDALTDISNEKAYKDFISSSTAEFSVAKETYVKANSGWFSGRSACYLASGKPVIAQDTKWSKFISPGPGLFAFNDIDTAIRALTEVIADTQNHSNAARSLAEEYFDSSKVLTALLGQLE